MLVPRLPTGKTQASHRNDGLNQMHDLLRPKGTESVGTRVLRRLFLEFGPDLMDIRIVL